MVRPDVQMIFPERRKLNRSVEFLQHEMIAIGWSELGSLEGKSRKEIRSLLAGPPYIFSGLELGNTCAVVDAFVNQMKAGDLVLVPSGSDILLGQIEGDYFFNALFTEPGKCPHQRKVTWLETITRDTLSMELRSALKIHRSVANLTKGHLDEIEARSQGLNYTRVDHSIDVVYPLRPDWKIHFQIPDDITKEESARLSTYFETLHFQ